MGIDVTEEPVRMRSRERWTVVLDKWWEQEGLLISHATTWRSHDKPQGRSVQVEGEGTRAEAVAGTGDLCQVDMFAEEQEGSQWLN